MWSSLLSKSQFDFYLSLLLLCILSKLIKIYQYNLYNKYQSNIQQGQNAWDQRLEMIRIKTIRIILWSITWMKRRNIYLNCMNEFLRIWYFCFDHSVHLSVLCFEMCLFRVCGLTLVTQMMWKTRRMVLRVTEMEITQNDRLLLLWIFPINLISSVTVIKA